MAVTRRASESPSRVTIPSSSTSAPACATTASSSPPTAGSTGTARACCSPTSTGTTSRACRSSHPVAAGGGAIDVFGPEQDAGPLDVVFRGVMSPPVLPDPARTAAAIVTFQGGRQRRLRRQRRQGQRPLGAPHRSHARVPRRDGGHLGRLPVRSRAGHRARRPRRYIPTTCSTCATASTSLIHDAQHTTSEYEMKRHWGHCTIEYAVHVAREAGARELALFHHCPSHGDDKHRRDPARRTRPRGAHRRARDLRRRRRHERRTSCE